MLIFQLNIKFLESTNLNKSRLPKYKMASLN